jgi:hypothetical protein
MDAVTQVVVWLDAGADALGRWLLAPVGMAPEWLSATAVGAGAGVLLLVVFKYTSNQRAIKRVRDDIGANLLALKLFKDSPAVAVGAQGRLLLAAGRLFVLALVPMVVMVLPVTLLLGQLSLWYDRRPLRVGEEAVVVMRLGGAADDPVPQVSLLPADGVETVAGPVRVRADGRREVWWNVQARRAGYHRLAFQVGGERAEKELAIGDGLMRVSTMRPGWSCADALLNPSEPPFRPGAVVRSITVEYAGRDSSAGADRSWLTCWFAWAMTAGGWVGGWVGLPAWMLYWIVMSMIAGLCFSRVLKVSI